MQDKVRPNEKFQLTFFRYKVIKTKKLQKLNKMFWQTSQSGENHKNALSCDIYLYYSLYIMQNKYCIISIPY